MSTRRAFRLPLLVLGLILLAPVWVLVTRTPDVGVARAQAQGPCTLETIKGTYVFHGVGVIVDEGEARPYAEAGVWTLDGNGGASGVISGSIDGVPFATRQAFTASYTLSEGCVYTVIDEFDIEVDLYTTPAGTPMTYYSPGFSGTHLRQ